MIYRFSRTGKIETKKKEQKLIKRPTLYQTKNHNQVFLFFSFHFIVVLFYIYLQSQIMCFCCSECYFFFLLFIWCLGRSYFFNEQTIAYLILFIGIEQMNNWKGGTSKVRAPDKHLLQSFEREHDFHIQKYVSITRN